MASRACAAPEAQLSASAAISRPAIRPSNRNRTSFRSRNARVDSSRVTRCPPTRDSRGTRKIPVLWLTARVVADEAVEDVILPAAVDAQVLAGVPFAGESDLLKETDRRGVAWQAGGFEPVEVQRLESEAHDGADRRRHQAL